MLADSGRKTEKTKIGRAAAAVRDGWNKRTKIMKKKIGTVSNFGKFSFFELFSLIFAQILMKFCRNFADNLENVEISKIFEFSRENSYFERIRMVRMIRMVRSLADRTFQL